MSIDTSPEALASLRKRHDVEWKTVEDAIILALIDALEEARAAAREREAERERIASFFEYDDPLWMGSGRRLAEMIRGLPALEGKVAP
jgi:hypothetical protein